MNYVRPPITDGTPIDLEVAINPEDFSIYIRIKGFDNLEDTTEYANFLTDSLPLILFNSDTKH